MKPTMIVLAGPNGAGKSTLYETRVAPSFAGPFINADIIQRDELRDPSPAASYEAAEVASSRRTDYLARRRDFVTETVFSHPSKLELIDDARNRGFTVIVMHVGVETPDLSVARVGSRVEEGGHSGHNIDHYAADAFAFAEALDLRNAVHVGHSTGGGEVARYVASHGEPAGRVAKAVLIAASPPLMLKTQSNP
jgi:pimeloyl-ACP methyl ester carboxylesterase